MRKIVKKLLDRTECILGTGYSFLFVTDFEKKKYKELYGEFTLHDGHSKVDASEVLLDSEWDEIKALMDEGRMVYGYDSCWDNAKEYKEMKYKLARKEALENASISKPSEEKIVSLYKKLDGESQMIILKLCEMLASRDG